MARSIPRVLVTSVAAMLVLAPFHAPVAAASIGTTYQDATTVQCDLSAGSWIEVANGDELTAALKNTKPGDQIHLADGTYAGTFSIEQSSTADHRIVLCGSRKAMIDGGDVKNGYA